VAGSPKKRARREAAAKLAQLKASGEAKIVDDLPALCEECSNEPDIVYSDEIGARVCKDLASGMTLRAVCRQPGMPKPSTVIGWAINEEHPFYGRYEQARLIGYTVMADDVIDISDDSGGDYVEKTGPNGETTRVFDSENVARSRLRVDSRKWVLAKALPKIYGDRIEHTGKDGAPLFPELVITYGTTIVSGSD
jgi:hypothetical protein